MGYEASGTAIARAGYGGETEPAYKGPSTFACWEH